MTTGTNVYSKTYWTLSIVAILFIVICSSCEKQVDYSADIKQLKADMLALQKRTDSLTAALASLNSNVGALSARVDSIKTQITGILSQIAQLNTQLAQANANITSINAQIADLNKRMSDLLAQLNAIIAQLSGPPSTINNGLMAWYPFTGNAGDSSGNRNNGIVNGASLTTDRYGSANKAYSFNGLSNNIRVVKSSFIEPKEEISVSCWIYPEYLANQGSDQPSSATQIIRKGAGFGYGYHLSWSNLSNRKIESHYYASWGNIVHGVLNEPYKNSWNHVVMTYSSVSKITSLYINGVVVSTTTCSNSLEHSDDLYIGGFNNFQFFKGKIDDIRIYNRILTQQEISYLAK